MDVVKILQKGKPPVFYSPHPYGYGENMNKLHNYRFGIGCGRATPFKNDSIYLHISLVWFFIWELLDLFLFMWLSCIHTEMDYC